MSGLPTREEHVREGLSNPPEPADLDVDTVIVTFNSAQTIETCISALDSVPGLELIVVDNASLDETPQLLSGSTVRVIPQAVNRGFAVGSNIGWRAGHAPYVLFLNPDAVLDVASVRKLVAVLERDATVGVAAPRFVYPDGAPAFYLRRFPKVRSTFAQALHLHHLFPRASWASEVITREDAYRHAGQHDWVPGACLLTRRSLLEQLCGFDETFFMYCEDKDLCRRASELGYRVWYEPDAVCVHQGGASAPRAALLPVLAESRMRYVSKHSSSLVAAVHRIGLVIEAVARLALVHGGASVRAGHARALRRLLGARG